MFFDHAGGPPKPKWTPFRDNLMQVLQDADSISDQELKNKLAELLDEKIEKYEVKRPHIILKRIH
jgi:hypothetical protein